MLLFMFMTRCFVIYFQHTKMLIEPLNVKYLPSTAILNHFVSTAPFSSSILITSTPLTIFFLR